MLSFKRIFATQQQALDVYKSQLSKQKLFVEAFEGAPKGTPVKVALTITETGQSIALDGSVERMMGKSEATQNGFGQRPGLMLDMPITPEIVAPLRAFFLTKAEAATPKLPNAPFMSLSDETATQVEFEVGAFLKKAETGNLFELFGMRPQDDRKILRTVYNRIVKNLHPDKHRSDFSDALSESLGDAYQILNEAYKILQHGVACEIYLEISREVGQHKGMSLAGYKNSKPITDSKTQTASTWQTNSLPRHRQHKRRAIKTPPCSRSSSLFNTTNTTNRRVPCSCRLQQNKELHRDEI